MKTLAEIKSILTHHKSYLNEKYGLKTVAVFGSYSRDDLTELSDVDLLVEFERPIGLDFVSCADEMEQLLEIKSDVVTKNALGEDMFKLIEKDIIYV